MSIPEFYAYDEDAEYIRTQADSEIPPPQLDWPDRMRRRGRNDRKRIREDDAYSRPDFKHRRTADSRINERSSDESKLSFKEVNLDGNCVWISSSCSLEISQFDIKHEPVFLLFRYLINIKGIKASGF